jgi:hypothetical protein
MVLILVLWANLRAMTLPAATVPHVIHISVDGLRGDLLQDLVTNAPSMFPNYYRLQTEGAFTYNARCDFDNSTTVPNHISMITGRPVAQPAGLPPTVHHGYFSNFPLYYETIHNAGNTNLDYVASIFDVVHDHGLSTGLFLGKTRLGIIERSYNWANGAPDVTGEDNGTAKIDLPLVLNGNTAPLIDAIANTLTNEPLNYVFLHIVDLDSAGHSYGWGSDLWDLAVQATDAYLGCLFEAIDSTPSLAGQVAILLSADHGGGGEDIQNHGDPRFPENYTIPFFAWGGAIPHGVNLYDLISNRCDPGRSRPDYIDPRQPIRNGDGANLALRLLGMPSVPGSFMQPALSFEPPLKLAWLRDGNHLILSWNVSEPALGLEGTEDIAFGTWQAIVAGIETHGTAQSFCVDLEDPRAKRYYRLRREQPLLNPP